MVLNTIYNYLFILILKERYQKTYVIKCFGFFCQSVPSSSRVQPSLVRKHELWLAWNIDSLWSFAAIPILCQINRYTCRIVSQWKPNIFMQMISKMISSRLQRFKTAFVPQCICVTKILIFVVATYISSWLNKVHSKD